MSDAFMGAETVEEKTGILFRKAIKQVDESHRMAADGVDPGPTYSRMRADLLTTVLRGTGIEAAVDEEQKQNGRNRELVLGFTGLLAAEGGMLQHFAKIQEFPSNGDLRSSRYHSHVLVGAEVLGGRFIGGRRHTGGLLLADPSRERIVAAYVRRSNGELGILTNPRPLESTGRLLPSIPDGLDASMVISLVNRDPYKILSEAGAKGDPKDIMLTSKSEGLGGNDFRVLEVKQRGQPPAETALTAGELVKFDVASHLVQQAAMANLLPELADMVDECFPDSA